jgi:hypothetical protein
MKAGSKSAHPPTKETPAPAPPDMAAIMKAAEPGVHHKNLLKLAGEWNVEGTSFCEESGPESVKGTAKLTAVLGGRYLRQEFTGEAGGGPFEGIGIDGYDNAKKKYVSIWFDSMSTGFVSLEGTSSDDDRVITREGNFPDLATGGTKLTKSVTTVKDANTFTYAHFDRTDGEWRKAMELTYRKAR